MTEDSQDSIAPLGYNDCDLASILNLDSTTGLICMNLLIYTIQIVIFKQIFNITLFL